MSRKEVRLFQVTSTAIPFVFECKRQANPVDEKDGQNPNL